MHVMFKNLLGTFLRSTVAAVGVHAGHAIAKRVKEKSKQRQLKEAEEEDDDDDDDDPAINVVP